MDRLFFELYLDEDVDVLVAELIRSRGFDVQTTQEAGQIGQHDESQLDYAVRQYRTLLTHNRADFETLNSQYMASGQSHSGIIIAVRRSPYELTQRLLRVLNTITADEMANQIVYV